MSEQRVDGEIDTLPEWCQEILEDLEMVTWDRFVVGADPARGQVIRVYGWIDRPDSHEDFVLVRFYPETDNHRRGFTTSSATYSPQIAERLFGEHVENECQRVERHADIDNVVDCDSTAVSDGGEADTSSTHTFVEDDTSLRKGFTLIPSDDPAARAALETYAKVTDDAALAADIREWVEHLDTNQFDDNNDSTEELSLSLFVDDDDIEVDLAELDGKISVGVNHEQVRLSGSEPSSDRTAEATIEGSPGAMATLADRIYDAAATAAHNNEDIDPLDGDLDV